MEHKLPTDTSQPSKALFLLLLLPLSTIVALIACAIRGYLGVFLEGYFFEDLIFFSILLSFLFIKTKRKAALSFAIIATVFQFLSSIIDFYGMSFQVRYNANVPFIGFLQSILYQVSPIVLCVLLVIYCVSPRLSRCYLFAGIISCGLLIINVFFLFTNTYPAYHGMAALFLLGFLTNSDVSVQVAQVIKPKQIKTDVSSVLDKLERFAQLKEDGILTAEEFEVKKQELMNQM